MNNPQAWNPVRWYMKRRGRSKYDGDGYQPFTTRPGRTYLNRNGVTLSPVSVIIRPGTKAAGVTLITPQQYRQDLRKQRGK